MRPTVPRRVRRLQVRVPRDRHPGPALVALEDALHTATIPGTDSGQLILIRRLALGRLPTSLNPTAIAQQIEAAALAAIASAVPGDSPAAAHADSVCFPDRIEALISLARHVTQSLPTDEWYWRATFPEWRTQCHRTEAWNALLQLASSTPAPRVATARLAGIAMTSGDAEVFLGLLTLTACERFLRTFPSLPPIESPLQASGRPPPKGSPTTPAVALATARWGASDARTVWVAAHLLIADRPTLAWDPELPVRARDWIRDASTGGPTMPPEHARFSPPPLGESPQGSVEAQKPVVNGPVSFEVPPDPSASDASSHASKPRRVSREQYADESSAALVHVPAPDRLTPEGHAALARNPVADSNAGKVAGDSEPSPLPEIFTRTQVERTEGGGLLFLLPLLRRYGIADFLNSDPRRIEADFVPRLLLDVARRSGIRPGDPLVHALTPEERSAPVGAEIAAWRVRLRRACRLEIGMGFANLLRRPARLESTPTHIDLFFAFSRIDVRIRRAGLDLDPGWVPWLGRVITFHYVDGNDD